MSNNTLTKAISATFTPAKEATPGQPWVPGHWASYTNYTCWNITREEALAEASNSATSSSSSLFGSSQSSTSRAATEAQIRDAYRAMQQQLRNAARAADGYDNEDVYFRWDDLNNRYETSFDSEQLDNYGRTSALTNSYYTCGYKEFTYWVAEQAYVAPTAATAAATAVDYKLGWNAGARSLALLPDNGYVEFTAPAGIVGAVAGLAAADPDAGYSNITHAFYLSNQVARIMESAEVVKYVGAYAAGAVFRITRAGGTVTYQRDGATVYTSAVSSEGAVFLDVSFYSGGDALTDPVIVSTGYGGGARCDLPPLTGAAADRPYGSAACVMLPLTGRGRQYGYAAGVDTIGAGAMRAMTGVASDKPYAACAGELSPLGCYAYGGYATPSYALGYGMMVPAIGAAVGMTGGIGQCAGAMAPMDSISADHAYGEAMCSMPPLRGAAGAFEGNTSAHMQTRLFALAGFLLSYELAVTMTADLSVATVFAVQLLQTAEMQSNASVSTPFAMSEFMDAVMRTTLTVGATVPVFSADGTMCWVLNAETGASSRYENYGYNSYCKHDGRYYGCRADGVYLLEGDDDAGLPIQAMVDLGRTDFGTRALKSVPTAYIGVSSTGAMVLKVIVEGATYHYTARDSSPHAQQQRIDLGRGLRANYYTFQLFNSDGADFALDSIEFVPLASTRRI